MSLENFPKQEQKENAGEIIDLAIELSNKLLKIRTIRPDLLTGNHLDGFDKIKDFLMSFLPREEKNINYSPKEFQNLFHITEELTIKLRNIRNSEPQMLDSDDLDKFKKIRTFLIEKWS